MYAVDCFLLGIKLQLLLHICVTRLPQWINNCRWKLCIYLLCRQIRQQFAVGNVRNMSPVDSSGAEKTHQAWYIHFTLNLEIITPVIEIYLEMLANGPLTRYAKLRVAHAPGMPGTFSPPPTSKETAGQRSQHASRHVRHARAVIHVGIANPRWRGKRFPGACATRNLRIW